MAREIERTYLVAGEGWREKADRGSRIEQGYLSIDPDRTVRVRITADRSATLTVKGRTVGAERSEFEYEIPYAEGLSLLELCLTPIVEKTRFLVEEDGDTWEVDVFEGANQGLVITEVELDDPAVTPSLPDWVGKDVTGDPRFYNANLVEQPFSSWDTKA